MRLDKYLTEMTGESRSRIKEAARKGRIAVNGEVERKADRKVIPGRDDVTLDGSAIAYAAYEYYMMNKPRGVVSATEDNLHRIVIDLLDTAVRRDLFPVGRLDIDTEGLLLITNDGALAHNLLSPRKHVDKTYLAVVEGSLPADAVELFERGLTLRDGALALPAALTITGRRGDTPLTETTVTVREGKFHQIKRMFEAVGCRVVYLKRLSMGNLKLDEKLKPGEYRRLTEEELEYVKR